MASGGQLGEGLQLLLSVLLSLVMVCGKAKMRHLRPKCFEVPYWQKVMTPCAAVRSWLCSERQKALDQAQCPPVARAVEGAPSSVRLIGAPPGLPGDRPALRRRSVASLDVALEGPFAEVLVSSYSQYVRAAAGWKAEPEARRRAAHRLAVALRVAHDHGWPWALLGAHLRVSGTRASQLAAASPPGTTAPRWLPKLANYQDELARASAQVLAAARDKPHLSEQEIAELAELAGPAVRNAGAVALGDPRRVASERFSAVLATAHDRGVTWRELSGASGLTVGALKARVARHGLGGQPATYKGVQSRPGRRS